MANAYFIMAHHKPEQLEWLVEAIYDPQDLFLLHVDLKSMLGLKADRKGIWSTARRLSVGRPNVRILRPRFTNWGGWSLSRLHLAAIDTALDLSSEWGHFINLSGQCYPIKPLADIRRALDAAGDKVLVEMRHFSSLPTDDWHLRWHPMFEIPVKAIKLAGRQKQPTDFDLDHKGSQWSILPREFCEWQRKSAVRKRISRYLKTLLLPDELVIQALVRNGPWHDRIAAHYGREIVFPGPKVMTREDWPALIRSSALFSRKFDAAQDKEILLALAERCGFKLPSFEKNQSAAIPSGSPQPAEPIAII